MPTLTELLRAAAGDVGVPAPFDELERRARSRRTRRHRRVAAVAAVTCLVVLAAGVAIQSRTTSTQHVAIAPSTSTPAPSSVPSSSVPASGPLFATQTGDVLIFDNGYDGITLLDVDHRVATRRLGVGQRAGDQPFRIARAGNDVLVGWGDVSAVPITGGPSRLLPPATVFVPAVEADRVWLVDYPNEAGTAPRAKFVEVSTGTMLDDVASPFVGGASFGTGIPGGFAMVVDHGIALWRLDTRKVYAHLGTTNGGQGQTFDAVGSVLAWCQTDPVTYACDTLHVTDLAAGTTRNVLTATYPGQQVVSARLSPDGTNVAVVTATPRSGQPGNPQQGTASVTIEGPGGLHRPLGPAPDFSSLGWSANGARLYVVSNSFERSVTSIDMWSAATDGVEHADLPFGGLLQFVTATEAEVGPFPDHSKRLTDCPAVDPSSETPAECTFGF